MKDEIEARFPVRAVVKEGKERAIRDERDGRQDGRKARREN